jgi:hypothetical protein
MERTKERGLVFSGWVPQLDILKGWDAPSIFTPLDLWMIFSSLDGKTASQLHTKTASRLPEYLV